MSIKVLLADDHKIVRDGLRVLVEKESDMRVVGEAADGRTAVQSTQKMDPDVVIMDIGMPDMNGVEAARQILTQAPKVKVIALSMHADKRFVSEMLRAGATGYLLKDSAFEELARAIRTVIANQVYLSPSIAGVVVKDFLQPPTGLEATVFNALTDREREVLQLVAEGRSTKEIADLLHLSIKTIETHRSQMMEKLKLYSVAELTKYAIREGLTSLDK